MAKSKQATGQITFRCAVDLHEELLEIARHLGIDQTALLTLMVKESLPAFLDRARKAVEEHARARVALDVTALAIHPLVVQLIEAGKESDTNRLRKITEVAVRHHRAGDPPADKLVQFALGVLRAEDELREIEQARLSLLHEAQPGQEQKATEQSDATNQKGSRKYRRIITLD